jgi:hypothetical protein
MISIFFNITAGLYFCVACIISIIVLKGAIRSLHALEKCSQLTFYLCLLISLVYLAISLSFIVDVKSLGLDYGISIMMVIYATLFRFLVIAATHLKGS